MDKCKAPCDDCQDKNSTHYFMCHMTQEDWEKRIGWSQVKKAHEFQYHFNKIRIAAIET
jgi:hypothetical protein